MQNAHGGDKSGPDFIGFPNARGAWRYGQARRTADARGRGWVRRAVYGAGEQVVRAGMRKARGGHRWAALKSKRIFSDRPAVSVLCQLAAWLTCSEIKVAANRGRPGLVISSRVDRAALVGGAERRNHSHNVGASEQSQLSTRSPTASAKFALSE